MNWFDIIVFLVLLGAFIKGMRKGLAMQVAGLVAIVIGAIFAGKAANMILPYLLGMINISSNVAVMLSYAIAFIIIVVGIKMIGKMLHNLFEALYIGFLNRILGAALGVVSVSLVLSILVNLALIIDTEQDIITERIKTETFFYSKIQKAAPIIVPYLKEEIWEKHIQERIKKDDGDQMNEDNKTILGISSLNISNNKILNLHFKI